MRAGPFFLSRVIRGFPRTPTDVFLVNSGYSPG
jgi:hypothetical protein